MMKMRTHNLIWLIIKRMTEVVTYSFDLHFFLITVCHNIASILFKKQHWIEKRFFFSCLINEVVLAFENRVILYTITKFLINRSF